MEIVKKCERFTIFKKRSNRHAIKGPDGKWINGDEKAKILAKEKLIQKSTAKAKPPKGQAAEKTEEEATAE